MKDNWDGNDDPILDTSDVVPTTRRSFLQTTTTVAMAGGLAAGYGTFFAIAGRFVFPVEKAAENWQFVSTLGQVPPGDSLTFVGPSGTKVVIARQTDAADASSFVALSSVCPHLGCQVHWEPVRNRFFCPCHNGAFDPQGNATEGPPAAARQQLQRYPLKVEDGLLFIDLTPGAAPDPEEA